jgi:ABC-type Zn2+ transport system substrate-binding protein/surface adhesin
MLRLKNMKRAKRISVLDDTYVQSEMDMSSMNNMSTARTVASFMYMQALTVAAVAVYSATQHRRDDHSEDDDEDDEEEDDDDNDDDDNGDDDDDTDRDIPTVVILEESQGPPSQLTQDGN